MNKAADGTCNDVMDSGKDISEMDRQAAARVNGGFNVVVHSDGGVKRLVSSSGEWVLGMGDAGRGAGVTFPGIAKMARVPTLMQLGAACNSSNADSEKFKGVRLSIQVCLWLTKMSRFRVSARFLVGQPITRLPLRLSDWVRLPPEARGR